MKTPYIRQSILYILLSLIILTGCQKSSKEAIDKASYVEPTGIGTRDHTPICLVPTMPESIVYGNDLVSLDCSNTSEGYIGIKYMGEVSKIKIQITCPNTVTYTYNLSKLNSYEVFPLTADSGLYKIYVFENIEGTQYSTAFSQEISVEIKNPWGPYLYPNQYVDFKAEDSAIKKAEALATPANNDLEVVENIYNYVVARTTYDYEKAQTVQSGYLPNIENTFSTGTGICLDYASLMASMLRSQRIPTHLEVGYAGDAYHAWISTYIEDIGWVNGVIQFDGESWKLMDPTFASSVSQKDLQEFIGDGESYETKYIY